MRTKLCNTLFNCLSVLEKSTSSCHMQQEEILLADTKRAQRVLLQYVCSYFSCALLLILPFLHLAFVSVVVAAVAEVWDRKNCCYQKSNFVSKSSQKNPRDDTASGTCVVSSAMPHALSLFFIKLGVILIVRLEFLKQQSTVGDSNSNLVIAKVRQSIYLLLSQP